MANASTLENLSLELLRVVERAQREPEGRFHSLAHLIDVSAWERGSVTSLATFTCPPPHPRPHPGRA
jgi:hypothetical protein